MGSYTYHDILETLNELGHTCKTIYYHFPNKYNDSFFCNRFIKLLKEDNYDFVMSTNFFPLIASLCNEYQTPYVSWCYDSPLEENFENYFSYDTNHIFLFDRIEVDYYNQKGLTNVHHLPLAVNTNRLDKLHFPNYWHKKHKCDVSFIGHLYESHLETLLYSAPSFVKGYIEGILQAQLRVYGYNFIDELITDDLLNSLNNSFYEIGQKTYKLSERGLSFAINSEITHIERTFLLDQFSQLFHTHFYSTKNYNLNNKLISMGPVKYNDEMPCVFRNSKLNLNPTLKSIKSGIPLRALDILGSGGALFSNYQPELFEYFNEEEDIITYSSMEEAFDKANFYIHNDSAREKIAVNGYNMVKKAFRYEDRLSTMLSYISR